MKVTGIDLGRQAIGSTILIQTDNEKVFELRVVSAEQLLVEVSGTDPRLRTAAMGAFAHSVVRGKKVRGWIVKDAKMFILFKNGGWESPTVRHATISGRNWTYEVF